MGLHSMMGREDHIFATSGRPQLSLSLVTATAMLSRAAR